MYGIDKKTWDRMVKERELHEVFVPTSVGYAKAKERQKVYEKLGHEVIPYEDVGVSVGIYVLRKVEDDVTCSDKAGDIPS